MLDTLGMLEMFDRLDISCGENSIVNTRMLITFIPPIYDDLGWFTIVVLSTSDERG